VPVVTADRVSRLWWAQHPAPAGPGSGARQIVVGVLSSAFPPGTVVALPDARRPSGWRVAVETEVASGRVHVVQVALPDAPQLWYVEVAEPGAAPAATTLVAFSDASYGDGRVLTGAEARADRISGASQVAALRWWPGTGLVHQIYVRPSSRRRGVAAKLAHAAFGVQAVRGLPPLHGDGRRTDLGELWRNGLPEQVARLMAPRSMHLPPMTPEAEASAAS
jgi:GNAT superfamily N-acetyltransferase